MEELDAGGDGQRRRSPTSAMTSGVQAAAFSLAAQRPLSLTGAEEAAYNVATGVFSEVVGIYYGKTYFGEEARQTCRPWWSR